MRLGVSLLVTGIVLSGLWFWILWRFESFLPPRPFLYVALVCAAYGMFRINNERIERHRDRRLRRDRKLPRPPSDPSAP